MTRWWLAQCEVCRGLLPRTIDLHYGDFLIARFPERVIEFWCAILEDGTLVPFFDHGHLLSRMRQAGL